MKLKKQGVATIGLIFITFLAAIQYVFLRNVPETVSTFAFVFITNIIGLVILDITRPKKLVSIPKRTLKKGVLFALELTGFNFFLLLGSQHMDAVIISSVVSLYFVFITPMLLLIKQKVSFFSGIATVIAIIALLLMFGADTTALFSSVDVVYLILADLFFAAYVVSVSVFGQAEESGQLTLAQMIFSALFAAVGWGVECLISGRSFGLPVEASFWISALFIGVFIRAVYGLIQISAQKHISALKTSLIFSAEIIITLLANPILCRLMNMDYTPMTVFQVFGGILLIIATLMVDDTIMGKLGYEDLQDTQDGSGRVRRSSVARKIMRTTLTFSMITLIFSTVTFMSAMYYIRTDTVGDSQKLGETASVISADAMMQELEESLQSQTTAKALLAEQKLSAYSDSISWAASFASTLYLDADEYPSREVPLPSAENAGTWVMQRTLANTDVNYEQLVGESRLLGNMEAVFLPIVENSENIATIYLGTETGLLVSYDQYSDSAVDVLYEFRDSVWYRQGRDAGTCVFTDTYQDGYGRGLTITCVAPFYDAAGQFAGCVAMDVLMHELNSSMVNDGIQEPTVATLFDHEGNYIAGRDVDALSDNMGSIFDEGRDEALRQVGAGILEKKNGIVSVGEGEDATYIAFATIESTDWTLCIMSPVSTVIAPALAIRESIDQNTEAVVSSVMKGIQTVIQSCLLLSAVILLAVTLFTGKFSKKISDPLKTLEADVRQISGGNLDNRTLVRTDDEIGSLADSFNHMTDSLQKYIADLTEATAKEERIVGELAAATNIQASMLPRNFADFSECREFDLYASMVPAKEVGGDFYDFFRIDDDHICLVMADVSGKGVPAALFMVVAKTLIKSRAQHGESPAEILSNVNAQLCENNEQQFFVTVWLAVIELSTGRGIAANAGHEHPVLRRADGTFEPVIYRHSPAVATMEGVRFREHPFELHPGDRLFVYTDGVPEATDAGDQLFGMDRLLAALNSDPLVPPKQLLQNVHCAIDAFVGSAPQFDDTTMMCFHYYGTDSGAADGLTLDATVDNLPKVLAFVDERLEALGCPMPAQMQIDVAVEELFVNIAHYAYAPGVGSATVLVSAVDEPRSVEITLIDGGVPYNPLAKPDPDVSLSAEERAIGGLGIYMVKKTMDDVRYEYRGGKNVLTIRKTISGA